MNLYLVKRYLVREPVTGVLLKYTRYASGNCTIKPLIQGARAYPVPVSQFESDLKTKEVLQEY